MVYKAIIFDMNGTLLRDSYWHEKAWIEVAQNLRQKPLTVEEFVLNCHGLTNKGIITYLLKKVPDNETLNQIVEAKEGMYRNLCIENKEQFKLAAGVIEFLDATKAANIPITIATGSYKPNVEFYFRHLNLGNWFNIGNVILDDGTYDGKPKPFVYLKAAQKLNVTPGDCLVFEDSYSGIQAAYSAGIGRIIAVEPTLNKQKVAQIASIYRIVDGFEGLNVELLMQH